MLTHHKTLSVLLSFALLLTACAQAAASDRSAPASSALVESSSVASSGVSQTGETQIILSDDGITVDGATVSTDETAAVYAANDIVFYLEGQGFTYGEGGADDEHSQAEADAHTVVHITKAGAYRVSGTISAGQIAVDLGEGAESDPEAVVTLILDNADITCTVAPAILFYRVYECGSADADTASSTVDTSAAGANLVLANDSENRIAGSYVAKIYKSYELSEDGKSVESSKKLHKYDGAVYSKMSMNVDGSGSLFIDAENEGLDSELHLTINGGTIRIESGDDGINTNEDGVSVTTINGGDLTVKIKDSAEEGDGIDSNGWIVINGGTVRAYACATSGDSGLDSDCGILLNGGTVTATGNMLDAIGEGFGGMNGAEPSDGMTPPDAADGSAPDPMDGQRPDLANGGPPSGGSAMQTYVAFTLAARQSAGEYEITDSGQNTATVTAENDFTVLLYSSPSLASGTAALSKDGQEIASSADGAFGGMGRFGGKVGRMPPDFANGERPDFGDQRPDFADGRRPDFANERQTPPNRSDSSAAI